MLDTMERPCTDEITEPAKQWQNRGLVLVAYRSLTTLKTYKPGDIVYGNHLWPTKEIAETKVAEFARDPRHVYANGKAEYLGAFPVTHG